MKCRHCQAELTLPWWIWVRPSVQRLSHQQTLHVQRNIFLCGCWFALMLSGTDEDYAGVKPDLLPICLRCCRLQPWQAVTNFRAMTFRHALLCANSGQDQPDSRAFVRPALSGQDGMLAARQCTACLRRQHRKQMARDPVDTGVIFGLYQTALSANQHPQRKIFLWTCKVCWVR